MDTYNSFPLKNIMNNDLHEIHLNTTCIVYTQQFHRVLSVFASDIEDPYGGILRNNVLENV